MKYSQYFLAPIFQDKENPDALFSPMRYQTISTDHCPSYTEYTDKARDFLTKYYEKTGEIPQRIELYGLPSNFPIQKNFDYLSTGRPAFSSNVKQAQEAYLICPPHCLFDDDGTKVENLIQKDYSPTNYLSNRSYLLYREISPNSSVGNPVAIEYPFSYNQDFTAEDYVEDLPNHIDTHGVHPDSDEYPKYLANHIQGEDSLDLRSGKSRPQSISVKNFYLKDPQNTEIPDLFHPYLQNKWTGHRINDNGNQLFSEEDLISFEPENISLVPTKKEYYRVTLSGKHKDSEQDEKFFFLENVPGNKFDQTLKAYKEHPEYLISRLNSKRIPYEPPFEDPKLTIEQYTYNPDLFTVNPNKEYDALSINEVSIFISDPAIALTSGEPKSIQSFSLEDLKREKQNSRITVQEYLKQNGIEKPKEHVNINSKSVEQDIKAARAESLTESTKPRKTQRQ